MANQQILQTHIEFLLLSFLPEAFAPVSIDWRIFYFVAQSKTVKFAPQSVPARQAAYCCLYVNRTEKK